jgi:hypothetical protein
MKLRLLGVTAVVAVLAALVPAAAASADGGNDYESHLTGVVESLPASGLVGDWVVSGTTVHVTDATEIDQEDASVAVGATVEVEGVTETDGSITATKVEAKESSDDDSNGEVEFEGTIDTLPGTTDFVGDWSVSGTTVHVTSSTEIDHSDGAVAVGAAVEVYGLLEADGSITATKVEVKDSSDIEDGSLCLTGTATAFPETAARTGNWLVSQNTVHVRRATAIVHARQLSRGSTVRVFGSWRADGSIRASKVVVRS